MNGFASGEHGDELLDASTPRLCTFRGVDPIQHRVAVLGRKDLEHGPCSRLGGERSGKVGWYLDAGRASVGGFPTAVCFGPLHFGNAGWMHSPLKAQPCVSWRAPATPRPTLHGARRAKPAMRRHRPRSIPAVAPPRFLSLPTNTLRTAPGD